MQVKTYLISEGVKYTETIIQMVILIRYIKLIIAGKIYMQFLMPA